jgi:methylglutaconyl-CoA hydratase
MQSERLRVDARDGAARVTLNRPDVRNALDAATLHDLEEAFALLARDASVRVVVLEGAGKAFCAGADVSWMKASLALSADENRRDAQALADVLTALDTFPAPVIGRVHGAAMGGGSGLVAACDLVVASEDAKFSFSEVKLGIVPGVISAFVVPKIGASQARRYFLTAEAFPAARAREIGLVHEVVPAERLEAVVHEWTTAICNNGPKAVAAAKQLIRQVAGMGRMDALALGVDTIARLRQTDEAQEGLRAFLEKRPPSWIRR